MMLSVLLKSGLIVYPGRLETNFGSAFADMVIAAKLD